MARHVYAGTGLLLAAAVFTSGTMTAGAMRDQFTGPVIETVQKTRTTNGPTNVTVTGVQVEGDTATATLDGDNEALGRQTVTLPMERLDGWIVSPVS